MSNQNEKYCSYCGTLIPYMDEHCPSCGSQLPIMPGMTPRKKSSNKKPWLAFALSLVLTGLGQLYVGEWRKGVTYFTITCLLGYILSTRFEYSIVMLFGVAMAVLSAIDAYKSLKQKQ